MRRPIVSRLRLHWLSTLWFARMYCFYDMFYMWILLRFVSWFWGNFWDFFALKFVIFLDQSGGLYCDVLSSCSSCYKPWKGIWRSGSYIYTISSTFLWCHFWYVWCLFCIALVRFVYTIVFVYILFLMSLRWHFWCLWCSSCIYTILRFIFWCHLLILFFWFILYIYNF